LIVSEFYHQPPSPDLGREQVSQARQRGARLLFVFTGGVQNFNHRRQVREMLGTIAKSDQIDVEYFPEADHLFSRRQPRLALFGRVQDWYSKLLSSSAQSRSHNAFGKHAKTPVMDYAPQS
jgi:hypothetical protein